MTTATGPQQLSDAIVDFSLQGKFPEDVSSLPPVSETDIQPTIEALAVAKANLKVRES